MSSATTPAELPVACLAASGIREHVAYMHSSYFVNSGLVGFVALSLGILDVV